MGEDIILAARGWLGTPYRHQASCKGAGTDCLGLLRGVWREVYGAEPELVPAYTADWSEPDGQERLLEAASRHLTVVSLKDVQAGDLLVFRMRETSVAKHLGLLATPETFIHAYSGYGVVVSPLSQPWCRRIAGVFRFPPRSF